MHEYATFNILMYSCDTCGMDRIRKTMAIAEQLGRDGINIIILTGSLLAGRLTCPRYVDYVRIPAMFEKSDEEYLPLTTRFNPSQVFAIRQSIIMSTVTSFLADLLIVDTEPLGLREEMLPALEWIKENLKRTKNILGLEYIPDGSVISKTAQINNKLHSEIKDLYDDIWVYGNRNIYNWIKEFEIS